MAIFDEDFWQNLTVQSASTYGFFYLVLLLVTAARRSNNPGPQSRMDKFAQDIKIPDSVDFIEEKMDKPKDSLVRKDLGQVIELAYWVVKFVSDVEKQFQFSKPLTDEEKIFTDSSAAVIKYSRYLLKFIRSFEKLTKL